MTAHNSHASSREGDERIIRPSLRRPGALLMSSVSHGLDDPYAATKAGWSYNIV